MKTTSIEAYWEILDDGSLSNMQREVAREIARLGSATGRELDEALKSMSAHKRLSELMTMGVIYVKEARLENATRIKLGMDPVVRKADVMWFKRKVNDVCQLMKEGKFMEAMSLVSGVASLHTSFHPSLDPEATDSMLASRVIAEREWLVRFFEEKGYPLVLPRPANLER